MTGFTEGFMTGWMVASIFCLIAIILLRAKYEAIIKAYQDMMRRET